MEPGEYTYTVRGVNKDSVLSPGYNKTGVSAVLSKRRITEKAPSGTAGGGFLVVGYKSDLRLDRGWPKQEARGI